MSLTRRPIVAATAAGGAGALLFAGTTADVLAGGEIATQDPRLLAFVLDHRVGWLTTAMEVVTWLGSSAALAPLLLVVSVVLLQRGRDVRTTVVLWVASGGAVVLYAIVKALGDRPRPPAADVLVDTVGSSYPSGHATLAIAAWGVLAVLVLSRRPPRVGVPFSVAAAGVIVIVGASRLYLGAHWFTDVVAGYALGGTWLAVVLAVHLALIRRAASPPGT